MTQRSFIPISLLTSFQFVKYFQGYFLEKNPKFKTDAYSLKCQTSQLNEDLGLIEYVFSDKTGTLTKNNMVFKSMYTDGRRYGSLGAEPETTGASEERIGSSAKPRLPHQLGGQYPESSGDGELEGSDRSSLKKQSRHGISPDKALNINQRYQELQGTHLGESTQKPLPTDVISAVKLGLNAGRFRNKLFFSILTCCHEVAVKQDSSTGEKVLNASSPDEVALLKFAAEVGFSIEGFDERTMEILVKEVDYPGTASKAVQLVEQAATTVKKYKLLAQFRFNSERSRMSVVVKDQDGQKHFLLCKGADHVMMERAAGFEGFSKEELKGVLSDYSSRGLRTLVYGYKELSEEQVDRLIKNMKTVEQKVGKEKELRMAELANETEQNLQILGASAVEDELQDDVRDTLRSLRSAGIKVWMLTGDKFETAVNIGYSSGLLKTDDKLIELKPEDEAIKEEELRRFFKELELAVRLGYF